MASSLVVALSPNCQISQNMLYECKALNQVTNGVNSVINNPIRKRKVKFTVTKLFNKYAEKKQ
jgi:hypothetical protein